MQCNDENPRSAGQSSLPMETQQAEAGRILSKLEGGPPPGAEPAQRSRSAMLLWGGGLGLGALAIVAAGAWYSNGALRDQTMENVSVLAPVALVKPNPLQTPLGDMPLGAPAAAIDNEPQQNQQSRKDTLTAGSATAPKAGDGVLGKALQRSSAAKKSSSKALAKSKARVKPRAKPAPEPDSDVILLAALMAHAQAHPEPPRKAANIQVQLKQCQQLSLAEAGKCRVRVCSGAKTDIACKPQQASSQTYPAS